jgi:hypothetical protein
MTLPTWLLEADVYGSEVEPLRAVGLSAVRLCEWTTLKTATNTGTPN